MKNILKNYSLSLTLFVFFIISWLGQLFFQWQEFVSQQAEHKQQIEVGDFINSFFSATFENWQSEFLQLFTMVVLTAYLIHKGSTESKDSDEEMKKQLSRIERLLRSSGR